MDTVTGEELGPNADGELCFKGPQVMLGYLNNPEATSKTIKNEWLHTGTHSFVQNNAFTQMELCFRVSNLKSMMSLVPRSSEAC